MNPATAEATLPVVAQVMSPNVALATLRDEMTPPQPTAPPTRFHKEPEKALQSAGGGSREGAAMRPSAGERD